MNPVMYIILNKGAGMSTGKAAAQAAHAAVLAYELSPDDNTKRVWWRGGHYTKIVLEAPDTETLLNAEHYIADRGFKSGVVIDEGRTEVKPLTPTALGVQIVDKDDAHVAATFSSFRLYRDERPQPPEYIIRPLLPRDASWIRSMLKKLPVQKGPVSDDPDHRSNSGNTSRRRSGTSRGT